MAADARPLSPIAAQWAARRVRRSLGQGLVLVLVALGTITTVAPFAWMVLSSFKAPNEIVSIPIQWVPSAFYWMNYIDIWQKMPFARFYLNSILVAAAHTSGVLLTASLGAYGFARVPFTGRTVVFLLYLGTIMVPGWVTLIPVFLIVKSLGWIDTYQGLIIPGLTSAFGTFLLRQFFLTIPQDLEDAAFIDGASRLQSYARIILPLSRPALLTVALFTFMGSWNSFLWPLVVTESDNMQTLPLGLARMVIQGGWVRIDWGPLMAGTLLSILPLLLIFLYLQHYFTQGVVLSGLK